MCIEWDKRSSLTYNIKCSYDQYICVHGDTHNVKGYGIIIYVVVKGWGEGAFSSRNVVGKTSS